MYACICEIGADFSKGCAHPAMQPLISRDLPPNTTGPEPRYWDSGPKWITRPTTVSGPLA
jgi:hypothetical protein